MQTKLSDKQIGFYRENGFLVIDDFLTDQELEAWRDALDEAVLQQVDQNETHNQNRHNYYQNVFIQCVNLWKTNEKIRNLTLDPQLGKLGTDLAGTTGMCLFHDHALIKQPWANPTNFHIDNPSDPYHTRQSIMFWVTLDDATLQNGCLYFLPGTHKTSRFDRSGTLGREGVGLIFDEYPEWVEIEPYTAEMKAGSCAFINGMVAHAAGPNMTPHPRRAFAMLLMPERATFNGQQSVLPDELFKRLKVGDVLEDDAEHLPLLFLYQNSNSD